MFLLPLLVKAIAFYCSNPSTLSDLSLVLYNSCSENPLVELTHFSSIKRTYSCRLLCLYAFLLFIVLVFDSVDPSLVLYCDIGIFEMNSKSPYGLITRHITNMYPTINLPTCVLL
jgi:hypothetical protein